MHPGRRLQRQFFDRPCLEVAHELVGMLVVRVLPDRSRLIGRLVEVEAYLGDGTDPGSHSHRGPTPRNRSMFGPPGRLYTYRSYGIHTCANVVCEAEGRGAAVLLRALEPLTGLAAMRGMRGLPDDARAQAIARGPARLCQALGLTLDHDGKSAVAGEITFHLPRGSRGDPEVAVLRGPRVGLTKGAELPHRFYCGDSRWVSPWRPGRPSRSAAPTGSGTGARTGKAR